MSRGQVYADVANEAYGGLGLRFYGYRDYPEVVTVMYREDDGRYRFRVLQLPRVPLKLLGRWLDRRLRALEVLT